MKIVMFGNYALYFIPRLVAFSEFLKSKGSTLDILEESQKNLLYENLPKVENTKLNIYHLWDSPPDLSYEKKIFYMLDKLNPDILITGFISFPYGAIGLKWAKHRHKGIIEYDDQRYDTFSRNKISIWVKSRIIRNVDAFICPAPAWDETLLKYGFKKDDIFYGPDTSDNDFWGKKVENTDFQMLPESYFMTVGRQTAMKNLPFFLSAYKEYLNKGGKIPLVMVGNGPDHEKLLKIAGNDNRITFLDFQTRENLRQLFVRMKALILPSTKVETWGMVVNECMASGHIVAISNECGSSTTLVKDKLNGFHFNPYSKKDIINALFNIEKLSDSEYFNMRQKSLEIIKDWGIDRFVSEVYSACNYAYNNRKKVNNLIDKLLIYLWKGRYNITAATK